MSSARLSSTTPFAAAMSAIFIDGYSSLAIVAGLQLLSWISETPLPGTALPERWSSRAPPQDCGRTLQQCNKLEYHYTIRHKVLQKEGLQGHRGVTKYQATHDSGQSLNGGGSDLNSGRLLRSRLGAAPLHRKLAGLLILARTRTISLLGKEMNPL